MAKGASIRNGGNVTFQDVQIRAADGRSVYLDYGVGRSFYLRVVLALSSLVSGTVVGEFLHLICLPRF
jgi:hypothetical protein